MELIYFANEKVIKMTPANCFFPKVCKYGSTDKKLLYGFWPCKCYENSLQMELKYLSDIMYIFQKL